jgi:site-specific DNA-methyltransferase (cytosine-N4-specific)
MVLAGCPVEGTVLDPFSGSATTGMVALQEGRNYIGCDLNPDYLPLAERRVREEPAPVDTEAQDEGDALDLFSDG